MKNIFTVACIATLLGCSTPPTQRKTFDLINAELAKAVLPKLEASKAEVQLPPEVLNALLPPVIPAPLQKPAEEYFSVTFNEVPARQFFQAIAAHSRYNMLVNPQVTGTISASLKHVTIFDALNAVRDLYGYDYTVEDNRIVVKPLTLQTRIFHINYLNAVRLGSSDTRVSSGSATQGQSGSNGGGAQGAASGNYPGSGSSGQNNTQSALSSRVSSTSNSDFWSELRDSLRAIVNLDDADAKASAKDGRSVVVSRQSGVIVVRAMPDELRAVSQFLKASQLSVERQVILEAKILEVQLNGSYQAGINWAGFRNNLVAGLISPGTSLASSGAALTARTQTTVVDSTNPITVQNGRVALSAATGALGGTLTAAGNTAGSLFGLAVQTANFSALLSFLETQGTVHVLSSPRIATLNNQKAILKVGTDDFFVTKVSTTSNATAAGTSTTPDVTLQQFFSGVVLDVTPQIDDQDNIILHVHPSVTQVTTQNKVVDLGAAGTLTLPLASSNTSETDSVVRGQNGQVIAIGGLMREASTGDRSQVPGAGDLPIVGSLFRDTNQVSQKRELVILIKPSIVDSDGGGRASLAESQQRIQSLDPAGLALRR